MRKAFGISAIMATVAVLGWTASVALAVGLSNPQEANRCASGSGVWHFVHVKTSATSGTLTATIGGTPYVVGNTPSSSKNLHYFITADGPLGSALDNVSDGKLVLSDCPESAPPPSEPPPTDPPPSDPPPTP